VEGQDNLAEAALCAEIEHEARESSRRDGAERSIGPGLVVKASA